MVIQDLSWGLHGTVGGSQCQAAEVMKAMEFPGGSYRMKISPPHLFTMFKETAHHREHNAQFSITPPKFPEAQPVISYPDFSAHPISF